MKQMLSMRDQQLVNTLLSSNKALNLDNEYMALRMTLLNHQLDVSSAFILNWIPEQGEDIYTVLIGDSKIAIVELIRGDSTRKAIAFNLFSIESYKQKFSLSKITRQKLSLAINLARSL